MTPQLIFALLKSISVMVPDIWNIYEDVKNKKPLAPEIEAVLKDLEVIVAKFLLNK